MQTEENKSKKPSITCQGNGPYILNNIEKIVDSDGVPLAKKPQRRLCRCGGSKYKPFCDGSHIDLGFKAPLNEISKFDVVDNKNNAEQITNPGIIIEKNGPYHIQGPIDCLSIDLAAHQQATLCRCGGSHNKPFCDGSHKENGFRDDHLLAIARIETVKEDLTRVSFAKKELVIVKRPNGLSVFSGRCLHAAALMCLGFIQDNFLTCGKHLWRYDLETGELDGDPSMALKKFKTKIENGWLLIERSELEELKELEED